MNERLDLFKKQVEDITNIGLLEWYSVYVKKDFRTLEEQEELRLIRIEILKRMEEK
jgi:hypothetical protein